MGDVLLNIAFPLAVIGVGLAFTAYYWRQRTEEVRELAEQNAEDAQLIADMSEANVNASRVLCCLADERGSTQDEVPRCQCGLLLRKSWLGEDGYPQARVCPMRRREHGHDSWVPQHS